MVANSPANDREYLESHPWLTFKLDLRDLGPQTWILLGEAVSKCDHIANAPLKPDVAKNLHRVFLIKGAQGNTAIEGNTLTEDEISKVIEGELKLPKSKQYLQQEVENILDAYNDIGERAVSGENLPLSLNRIEDFNRLVLKNLELEADVIPGEIRRYSVGVLNYRGAPHSDCRYLLQRLCEWLNEDWNEVRTIDRIALGIIKAIVAHIYIAWIHPFGDGNGRTARLLEFEILLEYGVPTPAAHLLSNFYNQTRTEYYKQLDRTSKQDGELTSFLKYGIMGFVSLLRDQLELVWKQVWDVSWESWIHDVFKNKTKPTDTRRRHLALDISRARSEQRTISVSNVRHLSARLAEHYAGKEVRTINRDLRALVELGLIDLTKEGRITPLKSNVLSLLPKRKVIKTETQ
jgi:Fic family protein